MKRAVSGGKRRYEMTDQSDGESRWQVGIDGERIEMTG